ncbi:MAG: ABC transporter ATP-binding protein [Ilumatobacteraceae bacterium]
MADSVVQLEGVGKRYRLGEYTGGATDIREAIAGAARRIVRRQPPEVVDLWSLRDVSFEVDRGESLGIIGANGAGKTTLLSIVSHITTPTEGVCRTRGRIGALLEVGTGFHGELTGIENTYLNGAILGMSRSEVTRRLDEIIDFAGVSGFMDTPVKRYSSGMYLRLGFAIAAHLEVDILVVDEVLAVGDAEFQRRCIGKISEAERSGRTVLFVSHNMEALVRLCPTAIWLESGRVKASGPSREIVDQYLRSSLRGVPKLTFDLDVSKPAQVVAASVVDSSGTPRTIYPSWASPSIEIDVAVSTPTIGLDVAALVSTSQGTNVLDELLSDGELVDISALGTYRLRLTLPPILTPGEYSIGLWLGTAYEELEFLENVLAITIEGDEAGRPNRLVKIGAPWTVARLEPGQNS